MKDELISKISLSNNIKIEQHPKIIAIPDKWLKSMGSGTMIIATPLLIDELINKIPEGKITTTRLIREKLAYDFKTDSACPLTTGLFICIAAEYAEADLTNGKNVISPYWRVVNDNGSLNSKFPGGVKKHYKHLLDEGFEFLTSETKNIIFVKDYKNQLFDFS